jgi:hypothetical protein
VLVWSARRNLHSKSTASSSDVNASVAGSQSDGYDPLKDPARKGD